MNATIEWHYVDVEGLPDAPGYYLISVDVGFRDVEIAYYYHPRKFDGTMAFKTDEVYAWAYPPDPAPKE